MAYEYVKIPKGKKPDEYNYRERRAEILRLIVKAGHPKAITQQILAERYGVSQVMISNDMKVIKKELYDLIGKDTEITLNLAFQKVIKDLLKGDNKDKYYAAKLSKEWYDWLFSAGFKEKTANKIEPKPIVIRWATEKEMKEKL